MEPNVIKIESPITDAEIFNATEPVKFKMVPKIGPGKRSVITLHREIAKGSRYNPHQGARERARRVRQLSAKA